MPNRRELLATPGVAVALAAAMPAIPVESPAPDAAKGIAEVKARLKLTPEEETECEAMRKEARQRMREQYRDGRAPG